MSAPKTPPENRRGFTVLEVVVVVAIIGLVTVLLLSGLSSVRRQSVRATCQANLHNIGIAASDYATSNNASLPTYYADPAIVFDTFRVRCDNGDLVNLGLLTSPPKSLYCPGQDEHSSPCLAYNSPENGWQDNGGVPASGPGGGGRGGGGGGAGAGNGDSPGPRPGVNASYTTRYRNAAEIQSLRWNVYNFSNKVIYSDFIGVNNWPGRGRFTQRICSPHQGEGYNRLFGDGSVTWVNAAALEATRPINAIEPTSDELKQYFLSLDVLR